MIVPLDWSGATSVLILRRFPEVTHLCSAGLTHPDEN